MFFTDIFSGLLKVSDALTFRHFRPDQRTQRSYVGQTTGPNGYCCTFLFDEMKTQTVGVKTSAS